MYVYRYPLDNSTQNNNLRWTPAQISGEAGLFRPAATVIWAEHLAKKAPLTETNSLPQTTRSPLPGAPCRTEELEVSVWSGA